MKPMNKKLKLHSVHPRQPRKTKDDFLRWLKKRRALEKLETEEQMAETDNKEMKQALMVWVDDGGPPA
jgi:hypothetical protein